MSAAKWWVLVRSMTFFGSGGLVLAWVGWWSAPSFVLGALFGTITMARLTLEDIKGDTP